MGSSEDITEDMVNITSIALDTATGRRLSAKPRGLVAGAVKVDYMVTYPQGHSLPALTKSSFNITKLKAAIQTKAASLGMSVTVNSVSVYDRVIGGGTGGATGTIGTTGTDGM